MASGATVNIRRDVDDKFYRYRMPVLLTKIEGKGNGIKTVIPNMSDVAKALSRPPSYTTKYFGCELGATTILDEKTDRWIVNGAHDANRMRELLDGFIDKFVLCGECKNPETVLSITKNQEILRDCKACGATTMVDMRHKLTQYILKNPPKKTKRKASDALKKERKDTGSGENTQDGDEDDDEIAKRLLQEAAELPDAEKSTIAKDEWSTDTNTETIQKRVAELAIQDGSDIEGGGDDPYDALTLWIETTRDTITAASLLEKVTQLDIKERHKTVQIISQSLFTDKILTGKEVSRFLPAFKELVMPKSQDEVEKKEKHQKALLGGLERLVGVNYPMLTPQIPKILMEWYQADILTEDIIKQWGTHVSKKYVDRDISKSVRKASEPFLKWLDEAEDDEEEENEE